MDRVDRRKVLLGFVACLILVGFSWVGCVEVDDRMTFQEIFRFDPKIDSGNRLEKIKEVDNILGRLENHVADSQQWHDLKMGMRYARNKIRFASEDVLGYDKDTLATAERLARKYNYK